MNEIEVVVDIRQCPDSDELIIVKQKLVANGELHPNGSPVETRLGLRVGGEPIRPCFDDAGIVIHGRAQPVFDTMPASARGAVVQALAPLRGVDPERWPATRVHKLKDVPHVYVVRVNPELLVLVTPTEHQGVEVVNIVRRATLDQFDKAELAGGGKAMTMLQQIDFSYDQCLQEARELQSFLGSHQTLKERDEILPFFKARKHLSAFLGVYNYHIVKYDRVAHEYPLFGDFVCDLVVGDWWRRGYVLVEFENAAPDSIFVKKKKDTPEWSPRFEHGFSQILDWFYKLDTQRHSSDFEQRFGDRVVHMSGLLIVGRKEDFGPRERDRLAWRQQRVEINGNKIHSMTFDDLCENILLRLATIPALQRELKAADQGALTDSAAAGPAPPDSDPPPAGT